MIRVCVYVDYVRNDVTLAAVQLADWLLRLGINVSVVAQNKVGKGIHSYWDSRVTTFNHNGALFQYLYTADYIFWFTIDNFICHIMLPMLLDATGKKEPKHIICPVWNDQSKELMVALDYADNILFLTEDNRYWFDSSKLFEEWKSKVVTIPLVSANKLQVAKQDKVQGTLKLLVILSKHSVRDDPDILLKLINLAKQNTCEIGLLAQQSIKRELRKEFKQLCSLPNVHLVKINYAADITHLARDYDLVFTAETRYKHGAQLSLLYASNTPIVAYRIPPVTSYISNYSTGYLLPCGVDTTGNPIGKIHGDAQLSSLNLMLQQRDFTKLHNNIFDSYKKFQHNFQDKLNDLLT